MSKHKKLQLHKQPKYTFGLIGDHVIYGIKGNAPTKFVVAQNVICKTSTICGSVGSISRDTLVFRVMTTDEVLKMPIAKHRPLKDWKFPPPKAVQERLHQIELTNEE